ncbi:MAG: nicotinate (nicotinamide) nucleotide adenylyltransferase [Erysipelotrichaceae bacterium]
MKVGLLGGSFDPIHQGHLSIAKAAKAHLKLDEIWFLPAKQAAFKRESSPFEHRVAMVKLAIAPYRKYRVCTIEGELDTPSYTIDTIRVLKKRYPKVEFTFLIGQDQVEKLDQWKDIATLKTWIRFAAVARDAMGIQHPDVQSIPMPVVAVSSTQIRSNAKLAYFPSALNAYASHQGLYLESRIKAMMTQKRFDHSKRVAILCKELAKSHGVDENLAYVSGLLHDVCKQMPYLQAQRWIALVEPALLDAPAALWHGPIGAMMIKRQFKIQDKALLYAVKMHVVGSTRSDLAMILYIADKIEPGRGYDTSKQIALAHRNLKEAFAVVKYEQLEYLKKETH